MKKFLAALFILWASAAQAQWQVPSAQVPLGKGTGNVGFNYVAGAIGSGTRCLIDTTIPTFGACGGGIVTSTPHTQDFIATTNFTPGTTTQLTLSSTPASIDLVMISFDGVTQSANTWSLSTATITFNAAIPVNTQVVEVKWFSVTVSGGGAVASLNSLNGILNLVAGTGINIVSGGATITVSNTGVSNVTVNAVPITGAVTLAAGTGTTVTASGNTVTIASTAINTLCSLAPTLCTAAFGYTNIMWYNAKCNGVYASNQNAAYSSTNLSIASGSTTLLSTGSTFTSADVGKSVWVPGAGVASAGLSTTISAFIDSTHVSLALAAGTAITTFAATQANPFVYGTDDTTAIQAAMTATPTGGDLRIPGSTTGCLIKQQGGNAYALLQDHPFSIRGTGHFSNLMTDPSIPATVDNLLVQTGSFGDWSNITWESFSIGDSASFFPPTLLMYTRHGKRGLALVDNASAALISTNVRNMTIGESSNDYSLYLGNPSGLSGAQHNNIGPTNKIWGGVKFDLVADSNRIFMNTLQGSSTFGGIFSFVPGAGKFEFSSNNVTWAGGFKLESGTMPSIVHNYFEELYATSESNNAMVDFNGAVGTIAVPTFWDNIINSSVSTTATPVRYANSSGGVFGANYIATSNSRTHVTSVASLSCIAPNNWIGAGTHFSTALANSYAGC